MNNCNFVRFLESSRLLYLDELTKILQKTQPETAASFIAGTGAGVILSHVNCTYIRPVLYPDTLLTSTAVTLVGKDRFALSHTMYSTAQSAVVAVGAVELVTYDYVEQRKCAIPHWLLEAMESLETEKGNAPLKKSDDMGDFPSKRARLYGFVWVCMGIECVYPSSVSIRALAGLLSLSLSDPLSQMSLGSSAPFGNIDAPSFSVPPELENDTVIHRGDVRWGDMVCFLII